MAATDMNEHSSRYFVYGMRVCLCLCVGACLRLRACVRVYVICQAFSLCK